MQVEAGCQRVCGSLGSEVHRLALQVQVLEETDTLAQEAEAVRIYTYFHLSGPSVYPL